MRIDTLPLSCAASKQRVCAEMPVHSHSTLKGLCRLMLAFSVSCLDLQRGGHALQYAVCDVGEVRLGREVLEYVANTLIFVLSGVIISNRVHTSSQGEGAIVHALDYAYALLLWVYLLVRPLPFTLHSQAPARASVTPCHPPAGSRMSPVQT